MCGTPEYLAPEILRKAPYGKSVDFWNFGCLVFELLTGHSPFYSDDNDTRKMAFKILKGEFEMPDYVPETAADLIRQLLDVDPKTRLGTGGVDQIKEHPFFQEVDWEELLRNSRKGPLLVKNGEDEMRLRALNINFFDEETQDLSTNFELPDFSYNENRRSDPMIRTV